MCLWGNHIGLPLHNGVFVGADRCVCPDSHVEIILRRHLVPIARSGLISCPPPCRGNLNEGVINCCFCELWLGDCYYNTDEPSRSPRRRAQPRTAIPTAVSTKLPKYSRQVNRMYGGSQTLSKLYQTPNAHRGITISQCANRVELSSNTVDSTPAATASNAISQNATAPLSHRSVVRNITSATLRNHTNHAPYSQTPASTVPDDFPETKRLTSSAAQDEVVPPRLLTPHMQRHPPLGQTLRLYRTHKNRLS